MLASVSRATHSSRRFQQQSSETISTNGAPMCEHESTSDGKFRMIIMTCCFIIINVFARLQPRYATENSFVCKFRVIRRGTSADISKSFTKSTVTQFVCVCSCVCNCRWRLCLIRPPSMKFDITRTSMSPLNFVAFMRDEKLFWLVKVRGLTAVLRRH